jgi:hypothetical protein
MWPVSLFGMGEPKTLPPRSSDKLNEEINAALVDLRSGPPFPTWAVRCFPARTPTSVALIADETEKWAMVVKFSGRESGLIGASRDRIYCKQFEANCQPSLRRILNWMAAL